MSAGSLATRGKSQLKQARQAAIRRAAARSWFPLAGAATDTVPAAATATASRIRADESMMAPFRERT